MWMAISKIWKMKTPECWRTSPASRVVKVPLPQSPFAMNDDGSTHTDIWIWFCSLVRLLTDTQRDAQTDGTDITSTAYARGKKTNTDNLYETFAETSFRGQWHYVRHIWQSLKSFHFFSLYAALQGLYLQEPTDDFFQTCACHSTQLYIVYYIRQTGWLSGLRRWAGLNGRL